MAQPSAKYRGDEKGLSKKSIPRNVLPWGLLGSQSLQSRLQQQRRPQQPSHGAQRGRCRHSQLASSLTDNCPRVGSVSCDWGFPRGFPASSQIPGCCSTSHTLPRASLARRHSVRAQASPASQSEGGSRRTARGPSTSRKIVRLFIDSCVAEMGRWGADVQSRSR